MFDSLLLHKLQLYLDNNALNGTIPDALGGAPLLNLFQVDHVRAGKAAPTGTVG